MPTLHSPPQARDETFEALRPLLFSVAYRMLGSVMDAEDAVQEAFVRWRRAGAAEVRSPQAFLTTVVTRLCINQLGSARARRETYVGPWLPEPLLGAWTTEPVDEGDDEMLSLGFLLLLERLSPAERAVFVLREAFDLPFADIAAALEKTEDACRQLLSRARRNLESGRARFRSTPDERSRLMRSFGEAAGTGDLEALRAMLAEDVVLLSDGGGRVSAARNPVRGADFVSRFFLGFSRKAGAGAVRVAPVRVNGRPGFAVQHADDPPSVFTLDVTGGRVTAVYILRNPDKLRGLEEIGFIPPATGDDGAGPPP